jgi:cytochrome c-type biogenesis protein CcmF
MKLVGELSLWVALLMAIWATTAGFAGAVTRRGELVASAERAMYAMCGFVVLASIGLWEALLTSDFSFRFVASFTSANLPTAYKIAAFWGGQAGSLLFWLLILAVYSAIAVYTGRRSNRELMPYVVPTLAVIGLFFILTICFGANPYERLPWIPPDGRGMNPQLQNPGMAIHPPNLYLGYIATSIPFAYAVAALITRRLDSQWLTTVRRWVLVSWFFNTAGIIIGMWWAYVTLGWGGYWAWDPVENASFLPWLVNTAFLHSIMVQEKRGMLRKWNVTLVVSAFLLSILGTFITRSGVISSVHAFAQSEVGYWFLGFLALATAISAYLVTTRLQDLKATAELESMVSREASFLFNNLLLVGIAFSVLWGTLFPILSEAVRGTKITVGPPFFNQVNVPLGLALLALTGIGPLIAWRRASAANLKRQFTGPVVTGIVTGAFLVALGMRHWWAVIAYVIAAFVLATIVQEFYKGTRARHRMYGESLPVAFLRLIGRNRRRYGGYIVHVGIVLLFAAFAGLAFKEEFDVSIKGGQAYEAVDPYGDHWRFVSQGVSRYEELNRQTTAVLLEASRNGKRVGVIKSEKRQYVDSNGNPTFEPSSVVGILGGLRQDVYVVLAGVTGEDTAEMRITFNPLVWWVWYGGVVIAIGGLIVMWPRAERRKPHAGYATVLEPASATAEAGQS